MAISITSVERERSRATLLSPVEFKLQTDEVSLDEAVKVSVRAKLEGGLVDAFRRATWQEAYAAHDILLRLQFGMSIRSGGQLFGKTIVSAKWVKKGILFWTRDANLTDNVTNMIWAMAADENGYNHFFEDEQGVRDFLFTFTRELSFLPVSLGRGEHRLHAEVFVKWWRHTYIERGQVAARSPSISLKVR
ncbi:MAG: hypothetical protein JRN37_10040 [Nitrososphaerota archaeon]|nr:hypothetical protein [Nitrososphaerota archaeon]MDG7039468.1 hypothetical protein [Nitrososphaerota archaeon]MDG7040917.1 hypothetical protein [Nitrososphaerota archaeon]MDG7041764.1 hypothetical protein [Nitrososphaerota archaeon]MDG7046807.1 hypothetical protein [Nitrososphaerota archaeon]